MPESVMLGISSFQKQLQRRADPACQIFERLERFSRNVIVPVMPVRIDYIVVKNRTGRCAEMPGLADIPRNLGIKMTTIDPYQIERTSCVVQQKQGIDL